MKMTKGKLSGGSTCGEDSTILTVLAPGKVTATIGEQVIVIGESKLGADRLKELHDYLTDLPALMDESKVKQGVYALRALLNIPFPLSEL